MQDFHCYNLNLSHSTPYPITNFVSYSSLSESFQAFINAITKIKEPQKYKEALLDKLWRDSMGEDINSQERTKTWSTGPLPRGKTPNGCKWINKVKYSPDGTI